MAIGMSFAKEPQDFFAKVLAYRSYKVCWQPFHLNIDSKLGKYSNKLWVFVGPSNIHTYKKEYKYPQEDFLQVFTQIYGRFIFEHKDFFEVLAGGLGNKIAFVDIGFEYPILVATVSSSNYKFHHFVRNIWAYRIYASYKSRDSKVIKEGDTYNDVMERHVKHLGGHAYCGFSRSLIADIDPLEYLDILFSPKSADFLLWYIKHRSNSYSYASQALQKYVLNVNH